MRQYQKRNYNEILMRTPIKSNTTSARRAGMTMIPRMMHNPLDDTTARHSTKAMNHGHSNTTLLPNARTFVHTVLPSALRLPVQCTVHKPVVMVDQLAYDWSSLQLDGTRAWNQFLEHRHHADTDTKEHPSVTALHTYQLMQCLKESLHHTIILPPPDSLPHCGTHETQQQYDDDASDVSLIDKVQKHPSDNFPEDLLPSYINFLDKYQQEQQEPSLKDKYQLMTANELCQYVQQMKRKVATLHRKEQRVLNTAKHLSLYPPYLNHIRPSKKVSRQRPPSQDHKEGIFMHNDDAIRRRYNHHIRKRNQSSHETTTTTNGIGTVIPQGQKRLWQDDDITTLWKKRQKSKES